MNQIETLLSALTERERLLRHARTAERHAATLTQAMDLVYGCGDLERGINDALRLCQDATGADAWMLVRRADGVISAIAVGGARPLDMPTWPDAGDFLGRARRITDLRQLPRFADLPARLQAFRSSLSVPLELPGEPPLAIMLLSRRQAAFSRFDQELLRRIRQVLEQAMDNRRLSHRNAVLARVLDSVPGDTPPASGFLDASFEALSQSYARVAEWQGQIVDITNELLSAPVAESGAAIDRALARTGKLAQSDRTYVFRLRTPERLDNTHEWVAPGIEPMIEHLQDMPASLLDEWRADLAAGRAVHIPDVAALPVDSAVGEVLRMQGIQSLLAVPILRDGRIAGFVGFDAVAAVRRFLPVEIQLLQAVANAVSVVVERARAEASAAAAHLSLERERNRLHATLTALPDLVLELDSEGRFVFHVGGAGLQAAWPPDAFLGRMPEEVLPPELAAIARHVMQVVDREGRTEGHEYRLDIDGKPRWFTLSAASKMDHGLRTGYVLIVHDITTRGNQQRQLARLGQIVALTSNLVVITDAAQRIEWVNPAFERRTGWTLDEVKGKRPDSFLATDHTDRREMQRIGAALRTGQPVRAELRNRSRSGEDYWISKDIQPLLGHNGEIEGFVAVQTDITELKRSHQRALRERAIALDGSNDGIAMTDADGNYIYMNATHRCMFGIDETEDVTRLNWRDLCTPAVIEQFMAGEWDKLQAQGEWRGQLPGLHRNGTTIQQEVSLSLRNNGILCITRDISERLRLEIERGRLREELQLAQRRETIATLASGVAHDLNNLVAVVAGSASLLKDRCLGDAEAEAGVARIMRATETARDLVRGLGHLGRPRPMREVHDLRALITEGVELLGTKRIRDHNISTDLPGRPQPVWASETEFLQVIVNLALNACDATGDRPNRVTLAVTERDILPPGTPDAGALRNDATYAVFTVSDTGAGMDPAVRERLFDRYFSTKGAGGTGLGLPIVTGILRNNDAALWVDSTLGRGTTVTVAWPAQALDQPERRLNVSNGSGMPELEGRNILVIDDLHDVADVLAATLETAGAIAISVADPHEAEKLLEANPGLWSAVVTDLDMQGRRGTDIARTAAACVPPVPVVLVTALPELLRGDHELFQSVLSKPVEAKDLIAAVRAAIPPDDAQEHGGAQDDLGA